jgi:hypothetical protein
MEGSTADEPVQVCPWCVAQGLITILPTGVLITYVNCPRHHQKELENSLNERYTPENRERFQIAVLLYAQKRVNEASNEMRTGRAVPGLTDFFVGHLMGWYAIQFSFVGGVCVAPDWETRNSAVETRRVLLAQRQPLFESGLSRATLETSFQNMNQAARNLGLPTVDRLD